ncbi:MAG TPA: ATP synthase subunit C family protein [Alphaproteobacteria bacterium]|jgi:F-type H+-transporting ATPase subunit c|nr:F0F1 ATP synthase subunit C [Micavibrio sp.]MBK9563025.1 F0F1 ATP synthase subunit C [Micavibrio sp.]HQX27980.1 ATP synthase subunit C family protein [Alphaproteobacteria bacterium]
MELEAAKLIASALALIPIAGVGIGLGLIFSSYNEAVGRNPTALELLEKKFFLTFALTEALAIFALVISLVILFG